MNMTEEAKRSFNTLKGNYTRQLKAGIPSCIDSVFNKKFEPYGFACKLGKVFPIVTVAKKEESLLHSTFKSLASSFNLDDDEVVEAIGHGDEHITKTIVATFEKLTEFDLQKLNAEQLTFLKNELGYKTLEEKSENDLTFEQVLKDVTISEVITCCIFNRNTAEFTRAQLRSDVDAFTEQYSGFAFIADKFIDELLKLYTHPKVNFIKNLGEGLYSINLCAKLKA